MTEELKSRFVERGADPAKISVVLNGPDPRHVLESVGDDRTLQACALAYLSDDIPTDAVVAVHPDRPATGQDAFEHGNDFERFGSGLAVV